MSRAFTAVPAVLFVAMAAARPALAQPGPPSHAFAACEERFARAPHDYESAYCFYEVTFQQRLWDAGSRRFEGLIAAHPENYWLRLAYGHVYRTREPVRAEALYRQAADGFQRTRHMEGEILARSNLRNFLFPKSGRVADAEREMRRVAEIAAAATDPQLKARAWILEGTHVHEVGEDLGLAYRLLKDAERVIFPDGPYRLKRTCLISLGNIAFRLGRLDEALAIFRRLDDTSAAEGERLVQATARYNILATATLQERLLPRPDSARDLLAMAERALATATAAQNLDIALKSHHAIAELLAPIPDERATALDHVDRCLALAVRLSQADDEALCAWTRASLLRYRDPHAALAAEQHAIAADSRASSPITHGFTAGRRMRLSWEVHDRTRAIADSLLAIDAIETLRDLQDSVMSSAELFSTWTSHYYWLSGRLLQEGHGDGIDMALTIAERMRARALLDIRRSGRQAADGDTAAARRRRTLREQISAVQRDLLNPAIDAAERRARLAELERLELEEGDAARLAARTPVPDDHAPPTFASVTALQSALGPTEALLSFQVGLWKTLEGDFGGGSWLIVVTRDGVAAHRIPDRVQLASRVPVFAGLLARQDGLDGIAGARLYRELLADAFATLPPRIERLIVIPDGPLHRLPIETLRPGPDAEPLAARFDIVMSPSATLWLRGRQRGAGTVSASALVVADPDVGSDDTPAPLRNAVLTQGVRLGPLPYARAEGRAIARHLRTVLTLVGADASERAIKDADLQQYGVLHLAAHAIADETRPQRSAVVLAAGDHREDGLLQAPEIESLDLAGRVVVLSACQTAAGAVLGGEGMLSLARAFLAGGAATVIGTRWPVRDEDAAFLFAAFYRAAAEGATLADALRRARIAAIDAGRPASVWGSLVLLGEGDVHLASPSPGAAWPPRATTILIAAIALAAIATRVRARATAAHRR